ncbi:MAG: DUF4845 domain-containing protein [Halofilum sp. (in: g-proteobacteria)]|nr:DUF4845 domain-containing protein [Halofilum sp. (in: g-proteobacteria)]
MAILLLVGAAAVVAIRIGPPYAQYITLVGVVESVHEDPMLRNGPPEDLRRALNTRMRLNEVDHLGKQVLEIYRPAGQLIIDIKYEVEKPLIGNAYILLKFNKRVGP